MKELLEKLFCKHEWEELKEYEKETFDIHGVYRKVTTVIFTCKHCGKIKKIEI